MSLRSLGFHRIDLSVLGTATRHRPLSRSGAPPAATWWWSAAAWRVLPGAQALADRGVEAALVEQAFCGAGASGKSSGFITPDSELESLRSRSRATAKEQGRELWEFAKSGLERIRRTIRRTSPLDCDYQVQDSLFVARTRRSVPKGHRGRAADPPIRSATRLDSSTTAASLEAIVGFARVSRWHPLRRHVRHELLCLLPRHCATSSSGSGVRIYEGTPGDATAPTIGVSKHLTARVAARHGRRSSRTDTFPRWALPRPRSTTSRRSWPSRSRSAPTRFVVHLSGRPPHGLGHRPHLPILPDHR